MFRVLSCLGDEHDLRLVVLAGCVCFLASIVTINLFRRASDAGGTARLAWLVLAGAATGSGIWATHFIAMLAYQPGVDVAYDVALTGLSLVIAMFVTGCGLAVAVARHSTWHSACGGALVGGGVASMHYTGMFALELPGRVSWVPGLVAASVLLGMLLGAAALTVAMRYVHRKGTVAASVLLTLAIVSHHFTAMGAVEIIPDPLRSIQPSSLTPGMLALSVAGAAILILGLSLAGAIADRRFQERNLQLAAAEGERTRALAEAVLAQGREHAAEATSRAKSTFLAMMSHEIRTPMNAVLGLSSGLLEEDLTREQLDSVRGIHAAADDLLNILNDILDYSKLEAGRLDLEVTPFSPAAIVDQALSIVGPRAAAKSVALRTAIAPDVPEMLAGDAGRLRQVLINLAGNAVKFTAEGEIAVGIRLLGIESGRARLEWTVSDTGIGIPADHIGNLFSEFVQADSSISRRFGGTGLGLAICKRIIGQMEGEISASSVVGEGSTFRFTTILPVAAAVRPAESDDAQVYDALRARIEALGRPLRLLITDDNTTNRMVAARMLKDFNIQTLMACNGNEALDAARRFPLDLILMDMRMPELDGLEATVALRAMGGAFATLPVIAFTANAFAEDLNACRNAGMNSFVTKPVRKRKLVEMILKTLDGEVEWSPGIVPEENDPAGARERARRATSDS